MMASLFWQLLVQMAILSPLGRTLTTAPHTSSLASSNDSPTKHKSCRKQANKQPRFKLWCTRVVVELHENPFKLHHKCFRTVSIQKRSRSLCLCCLLRVISHRPPSLFLSSSHIGLIPSWNNKRQRKCYNVPEERRKAALTGARCRIWRRMLMGGSTPGTTDSYCDQALVIVLCVKLHFPLVCVILCLTSPHN